MGYLLKTKTGSREKVPLKYSADLIKYFKHFPPGNKTEVRQKKNRKLEEKRVNRFLLSGSHQAVILPTL